MAIAIDLALRSLIGVEVDEQPIMTTGNSIIAIIQMWFRISFKIIPLSENLYHEARPLGHHLQEFADCPLLLSSVDHRR